MGKWVNGLKFYNFFLSPFLKIGVITADLSSSENVPVVKQQIAIERFVKFYGNSLTPVLVFLSLLIMFVHSSNLLNIGRVRIYITVLSSLSNSS